MALHAELNYQSCEQVDITITAQEELGICRCRCTTPPRLPSVGGSFAPFADGAEPSPLPEYVPLLTQAAMSWSVFSVLLPGRDRG